LDETDDTPEVKPRQQKLTHRKEIVRSADLPSSFFQSWNATCCVLKGRPFDQSRASGAAMASQGQQRVKQIQLREAQQHKPACHARDSTADELRVLEAREQAAPGLTTRELMDREGRMRPPNRIHDLREEGHAIRTVHQGREVYRYVLFKFLSEEKAKATAWKKLRREPAKTDKFGRPLEPDRERTPLFNEVRS
jgi:hypothetical protein